jgi:hypothetical protein
MGLVITIVPYPAVSSTSISPFGAVTFTACWKVRHGAASVHGFESDPVDFTKLLGLRAYAGVVASNEANPSASRDDFRKLIGNPPFYIDWKTAKYGKC